MQIGIAQINPTVGDIPGNQQLIIEAAYAMRAQQVDIVLFPEPVSYTHLTLPTICSV